MKIPPERPTWMSIDELREEIDAIVMTRGVERDIKVIAEAVSRLITLATSDSKKGGSNG